MTNIHWIDQETEAQRGQWEHIWKAADQNLQALISGCVPIPERVRPQVNSVPEKPAEIGDPWASEKGHWGHDPELLKQWESPVWLGSQRLKFASMDLVHSHNEGHLLYL